MAEYRTGSGKETTMAGARKRNGKGNGGITRRQFIGYTTAAGALAAAGPALPALTGRAAAGTRSTAPAGTAAAPVRPESFKWEEATIADLQAAMERGSLTSHHLVQAYIQRIKLIDFSGVQLNSVIEINPDALRIA